MNTQNTTNQLDRSKQTEVIENTSEKVSDIQLEISDKIDDILS
jgi:hypothetical protein